jgi:pimeloyl-ACP methyl ester carboxylesterase
MRTPIAVPVLQIHGAQDPAVSPTATQLAPVRHALLSAAGHFPHEELPDLFNTQLVDWLASSSGAGAS